jgi:hypothetical protein
MSKIEEKLVNYSTVKLFKSIIVFVDKNSKIFNTEEEIVYGINNRCLFHPSIKISKNLCDTVYELYFMDGELANNAFHKSWDVIRKSTNEELIAQAILHYFTTYGFEYLGIDRPDLVYIPHEKLEIPNITKDLPFVYVNAITIEEMVEKVIELGSGIALSQETLDCIKTIFMYFKRYLKGDEIVKEIKNRELKMLCYDIFDIMPSKPDEYLKYLVYRLTNETQIIKNRELIFRITDSNVDIDPLLEKAPKDLASVFFRYKPLFLAMKKISKNKTFFNQLRRKANKMHKPMPENYLTTLTERILNNTLPQKYHEIKLSIKNNASVFQLIRLINGLHYRIECSKKNIESLNDMNDKAVYQIRNGKLWIDDMNLFGYDQLKVAKLMISNLLKELRLRISDNFKDKVFYIPENIEYSVPTSEKQFIGNIPFGSKVVSENNMIFGIHWFDGIHKRVDLDLSVMSVEGKVGWNTRYKQGKYVLFSGDLTSAPKPKGASELFYMSRHITEPFMIFNNYFNYSSNKHNYKFFVANSNDMDSINKNYVVNPNNIIMSVNMEIGDETQTIGIVDKNEKTDNLELYFFKTAINRGNVSVQSDLQDEARISLINKMKDQLSLNQLILSLGGKIVTEKPKNEYTEKPKNEYIDLSIENLSKDTIINLFKGE